MSPVLLSATVLFTCTFSVHTVRWLMSHHIIHLICCSQPMLMAYAFVILWKIYDYDMLFTAYANGMLFKIYAYDIFFTAYAYGMLFITYILDMLMSCC